MRLLWKFLYFAYVVLKYLSHNTTDKIMLNIRHYCEYFENNTTESLTPNGTYSRHANIFMWWSPAFNIFPFRDDNTTEIYENLYICGPFAKFARELSARYDYG